jgi:hypothetical protein
VQVLAVGNLSNVAARARAPQPEQPGPRAGLDLGRPLAWHARRRGATRRRRVIGVPSQRWGDQAAFTARWPHDDVDLARKRVGVIGTGSSGMQMIPVIAPSVAHLTVFQRTPNLGIPPPTRSSPTSAERCPSDRLPRAECPSEQHNLGAYAVAVGARSYPVGD